MSHSCFVSTSKFSPSVPHKPHFCHLRYFWDWPCLFSAIETYPGSPTTAYTTFWLPNSKGSTSYVSHRPWYPNASFQSTASSIAPYSERVVVSTYFYDSATSVWKFTWALYTRLMLAFLSNQSQSLLYLDCLRENYHLRWNHCHFWGNLAFWYWSIATHSNQRLLSASLFSSWCQSSEV